MLYVHFVRSIICNFHSQTAFDAYECMCTYTGLSGGVQTGVLGCQLHEVFNAGAVDPSVMFCYINGGAQSRCPAIFESTIYPGAAFRQCSCKSSDD